MSLLFSFGSHIILKMRDVMGLIEAIGQDWRTFVLTPLFIKFDVDFFIT